MATYSLAALSTELTNDPVGMGYANAHANGTNATDLINNPSANKSNPATGAATQVTTVQIQSAIDPGEYAALIPAAISLWEAILISSVGGEIQISNTGLINQILAIFTSSGSPKSYAALTALGSRPYSRAETLWGPGTLITYQQTAAAKAGY
jgi:hypothetical protein